MHASTAAFLPEARALMGDLPVDCDGPDHDGMWWWPSLDHVRPDPRGALGWEESAAALAPALDAHDAVLGFSQGAAMAAVLCALHPHRVRFGIFACGYTAVGTGLKALAEGDEGLGAIDVPSLHIVGERDGAVPPEAGEHLASRFKDPVIVRTSAGIGCRGTTSRRRARALRRARRGSAAAAEAAPRRGGRRKDG
ncbi:transcription factor Iwr1 [Aureococcus anophagefferens]|nr:transcription factor Iwr1 [Aureococcus anophagefferens]